MQTITESKVGGNYMWSNNCGPKLTSLSFPLIGKPLVFLRGHKVVSNHFLHLLDCGDDVMGRGYLKFENL